MSKVKKSPTVQIHNVYGMTQYDKKYVISFFNKDSVGNYAKVEIPKSYLVHCSKSRNSANPNMYDWDIDESVRVKLQFNTDPDDPKKVSEKTVSVREFKSLYNEGRVAYKAYKLEQEKAKLISTPDGVDGAPGSAAATLDVPRAAGLDRSNSASAVSREVPREAEEEYLPFPEQEFPFC